MRRGGERLYSFSSSLGEQPTKMASPKEGTILLCFWEIQQLRRKERKTSKCQKKTKRLGKGSLKEPRKEIKGGWRATYGTQEACEGAMRKKKPSGSGGAGSGLISRKNKTEEGKSFPHGDRIKTRGPPQEGRSMCRLRAEFGKSTEGRVR